ncbi:MAG: hypothetical protein HKN92_01440 [Chitinophagales bacterium]|nr:hypothetical protein [Chitinophagales bacterium]
MICPHCKKQVRKKAKFCKSCGFKIKSDDFNFEELKDEDILQIDADLVAEIVAMNNETDESYDIEVVSNVIDLHISENELDFGTPLLQVQLEIAEKAVDSCIASGFDHIEFITGKGDMILYSKLALMLEGNPHIGQIETSVARIVAQFKNVK